MEAYKLTIKSIDLTIDNNPASWSKTDFRQYVRDRDVVIVGYFFKNKGSTTLKLNVNLYLINKVKVKDDNQIIELNHLKNVFLQWVESLIENPKSYMFRNPPLDLWLETKDNWMKKVANKLSTSYNKPYDECLSSLCLVITELYQKKTIYLGNLHYIIVSANNQMRLEYRYMLNRLHGGHPDAIHLDAAFSDFGANDEEGITSLHEVIIGAEDEMHKNEKLHDKITKIMNDLKEDFSEREIDQIVNQSGFLPMSLYRRLLKWRKTHKLEDYL